MSTLVMPLNYVEIDSEEMMYEEGGGFLYFTLQPSTAKKIVTWTSATAAASIAAFITAGSGGVLAAVAPIVAGGVAGLIADICSEKMITTNTPIMFYTSLVSGTWNLGTF